LRRVLWHGLTIDEPLVYESIIKGCFSNPDRKNFPDFMKNKGWANAQLYNENESAEYWINLIKPELIQEFNSE